MASSPAAESRARWPLAVCGVTPAARASSLAVSARPPISAISMPARAGSPTSAAVSAKADVLNIGALRKVVVALRLAEAEARRFGADRTDPRPNYRHPGEGRDPPVRLGVGRKVDPGLRRDDGYGEPARRWRSLRMPASQRS